MASRFENCVTALAARGEARREQVEEVLTGFRAHKARGLDDAAASVDAARYDLWLKQQARAQKAEQILKWREVVDKAAAHPKGFAVGARALLMADKYGRAGESAENVVGAYRGILHAKFADGIDAFRSKVAGLVRDVPGLVAFVRALYGENVDGASGIAASWRDMADFAAGEFIARGGALARREDWRLPNPRIVSDRVQKAGAEAFSKYLHDAYDRGDLRLLDYDTGRPADPVKAAAIIAKVVSTALTDGLDDLVPGAVGSAKIANKRTARRVLEWANAPAWIDANRRWGSGDAGIWDLVVGHIDGMATDIGLMHVLGPNAGGAARMLADETLKRGGKQADARAIEARYDALTGGLSSPVDEVWAFWNRQLGALHTGSKLLSSPLSAVGDMATLSQTAAWNGLPATRIVGTYLKAFGPGGHATRKDAIRLGLEADFWINRAHAAQRDMEAYGGASFLERSADFLLRASAASVQANNARAAFQLGFLGELADQSGRAFRELRGRTRRAFTRAGIGEAEWNILRGSVADFGGARYLDPVALTRTGQTAAAVKLLSLINREQDFAQVMGDLRTQMIRTLGTKAGTPGGFVAREFMRFKSYSVGMVVTHINRMIFETDGWGGRLGYGIGLGVGMTVMGALSMQMRSIANGRDPRDMTSPAFWGAAFLQGGGAGILGDFIKSGVSRTGGSFWAAVGGPTAGLVEDAVALTLGNIGEAGEGKNTNWGREAVRFLRNHTPGSNLWYARRAVDGYLWDYLRTVLDPNHRDAFRRTEAKARKELQQEFWWRPGRFGPERAPDLGAALGAR